jgi:glutamyl-tRNA reductase
VVTNRTNRLLMVGLSHQRAPLDLLEQVAVRRDAVAEVLGRLRSAGQSEAIVLSTCSRTEIYTGHGTADPDALLSVLAAPNALPVEAVRSAAHVLTGPAVVTHLFRVTAGLESRVVGEVDIYGQVRSAYRESQSTGMTGLHLRRLFPAALRCGLQVRARTGLASQGRSLARRAVEVGLEALPGNREPRILVIGSGQMAATAVDYLASLGHPCRVAARDETYAARLAGADLICPLSALAEEVAHTDLLICATSASQHVVTAEDVRRAMTGRTRPLTIVDLSLPRNVDSTVARIPGVELIDLAGLNDAAASDPALMSLVRVGAELVAVAAQSYVDGVAAHDAGPVIAAVRRRVEDTCLHELSRRAPAGFGAAEIEQQAHAIAGKLLHRPTMAARAAAAAGDNDSLLLLCEIFDISPADVGLAARADLQTDARSA